MSLPGTLLPWIDPTFFLADGDTPNALGTLNFFEAGTTTPQAVYSNSGLSVSLGSIVTLDASGRAATNIYLLPTGYKCVIRTASSVLGLNPSDGTILRTIDNFEDPAAAFLATQANTWTEGAKSQTSYTVTNDDYLVTMNGGTLNLQPAAQRGAPLFVKSMSGSTVAVTPNGAETIDGVSGAYTLAAASSPTFPGMLLLSDGVSNYWKFVTA